MADVAHHCGDGGDDWEEWVVVGGDVDVEACVVAFYFETCSHFHWLAVDVYGTRVVSFDDCLVGAEGVDQHVSLDESGHEIDSYECGCEEIAVVDYCEVEESVGY